jgi:bifunctional DNA-binding transcriptional regulator/antitoxin component of YhaV-PrlF toxin-antitoxin module
MNASMKLTGTLTKRGQISILSTLRKAMNLRPGQTLRFIPISEHEFRVIVQGDQTVGPMAMLGYAAKVRAGPARRTRTWMRVLREGELGT